MILDIIHLRAGESAVNIVLDMLADCPWPENDIVVYRREGLPGDVSVHVTVQDDSRSSVVAEQIASELRTYGLVQLTRWVSV